MFSINKNFSLNSKKLKKVWTRNCQILPIMVGYTFLVHQGNRFIKIMVTEEMVGHKFGEFSPTRIFNGHSGDKKTKK